MDQDGLRMVQVRRQDGKMTAVRRRDLPLACVARMVIIRRCGLSQELLFRRHTRFLRNRLRASVARGNARHAIQAARYHAGNDQGARARNSRAAKDGSATEFHRFRMATDRRLILACVNRRGHFVVNDFTSYVRRFARVGKTFFQGCFFFSCLVRFLLLM